MFLIVKCIVQRYLINRINTVIPRYHISTSKYPLDVAVHGYCKWCS